MLKLGQRAGGFEMIDRILLEIFEESELDGVIYALSYLLLPVAAGAAALVWFAILF